MSRGFVLRLVVVMLMSFSFVSGSASAQSQEYDPNDTQIEFCAFQDGNEKESYMSQAVLVGVGVVAIDESGTASLTPLGESIIYLGACTGAMAGPTTVEYIWNVDTFEVTFCDNGTTYSGLWYEFEQITDASYMTLARVPPWSLFSGRVLDWSLVGPGVSKGACSVTPIPTSTISGTISDNNNTPIAGATVCVGKTCATTGADGGYNLTTTPGEVTVTVSAVGFVSQTQVLTLVEGENTLTNFTLTLADDGDETDPTNSFTLTVAERVCADQSFHATWTGTNIASIEFALSNTSDNWTSGWLAADPASGTFTTAVDHHGYNKVGARVTFADDTTEVLDADVSTCVDTPTEPGNPDVTTPESNGGSTSNNGGTSSSNGSSSNATVTGLPSTSSGNGHHSEGLLISVMLMTVVAVIGAGIRITTRRA